MNEARSSNVMENLQELIDAETSAGQATLSYAQQYFTPPHLAQEFAARLPVKFPSTVIDPQCGNGNLIANVGGYGCVRFGIDIDNRITSTVAGAKFISANCVKVMELIDDLAPNLAWAVGNCNPPFGKRWKLANGNTVDSTEYTWQWITRHAGCGYFIGNASTLKRLGIDKHPMVYHYEERANVWPKCAVVIGIACWKNDDLEITTSYGTGGLMEWWAKFGKILQEEDGKRPPFNIYLNAKGFLRTYLSTRTETKFKLTRDQIVQLHKVNNCHPLTLTTERETRDLLRELVACGFYTLQPEAKTAIEEALAEVTRLACPIMPVTDFETVAYCDEEDTLLCHSNYSDGCAFTKGRRYKLSTGTYNFNTKFTRTKVHFSEEQYETYTKSHDCRLSGQDRYIAITDDNGVTHKFMDKPNGQFEHDESILWLIFNKPEVKTVGELAPGLVERTAGILRTCEMLAGYKYYPGQLTYLARVATKDYALIAADTGAGKTLLALSMFAVKAPKRALIIAPQGTMRSSDDTDDEEAQEYNASQWIMEIHKFTPYLQIFELFSMEDYERILSLNDGQLPDGVYLSYYQAMFQNGARETAAKSWDDDKLRTQMQAQYGYGGDLPEHADPKHGWCDSIGKEIDGIRCIVAPCMATLIGHHFDMVLLDEAHLVTNLDANVTQMLIRLQPQYRYALTATPIPNVVSNLFSLMGWLCVPDWFKGDRRNAAWPYSRTELGRFDDTFRSEERDLTTEEMKREADKNWNGKCVKTSPVISSPARLLKLIKPTMAYISKPDCNPAYQEGRVIDVRVPFGEQQAKLYAHYLNRGNIPASHPLVRARKQIAWLRAICADPAGFDKGGEHTPKVNSNMNPKLVATLELVRDIIKRGEQVVIVSSRIGLTNSIQAKLRDCGVPLSRIDSTIQPHQHAAQANLFKSGRSLVHLMGIKCAMGYSFSDCPNEIVTSLEYSYGSLHQAKGRVDRVNSKQRANIYCLLFSGSIEETMFDVVATKADAATICLHGKRIPREFKPVDIGEVLAKSMTDFNSANFTSEIECERQWPALRQSIREAVQCR
jgi:hypothetical protein